MNGIKNKRNIMSIDIHEKASSLLESLANSIHDRDPTTDFCFNVVEVQLVEKWLTETIQEIFKRAAEY